MFLAMRMAKAGFYAGDPERILEIPVSVFVSLLEYEVFEADYETEYIALNQPDQ